MSELKNNVLSFDNTAIAYADKSDKQLKKAYWLFQMFNNPLLVNLGSFFTPLALKLHLPIEWPVKHTIYEQFCGGVNLAETEKDIDKLAESGVMTILDYGVEAKSTEREYDKTFNEILKAVKFAGTHKFVKVVSIKITGLGRFELFERIHKGVKLWNDEVEEYERVKNRLDEISSAARDAGVEVFFDAEETWIQQPLDDMIEAMMEKYNREKVVVYTALQLYTNFRLDYLKKLTERAKREGFKIGAKPIRGAYMEKERKRAKEIGYPSPILPNKPRVNKEFNAGLDYCLDNLDTISLCVATHNEESCMYLANRVLELGLPKDHPHIFFAQLYGMGEHISFNLAAAGYKVAKLIPYGPVRDVIPYLVRRAQENSSVEGQMSRELSLLRTEIERRELA